MKKTFFAVALAAMLSFTADAVPARPWKKQVVQPDGTTLTLTLRGDEHLHYYATTDGLPLVRTSAGAWHYASLQAGVLTATGFVAHDAELRTASEREAVSNEVATPAVMAELRTARLLQRKVAVGQNVGLGSGLSVKGSGLSTKSVGLSTKSTAGKTSQPVADLNGSHRGLVVLVNFKDKKMQSKHTQQVFDRFMNEEGYSENGNSGSVHDYFLEQSYGQFNVTFDVVGPVTVSKNMKSYGGNDREGNDKDPAGMVYEALQLVKKQNSQLNFKDYDWDGDGEVDQVFLIYAGYGEASDDDGSLANTIWPHEWQLSSAGYSLTIDGVKVDTYGCSSELCGNSGSKMDGIGTACHEFSHCLGLPDLYDTSGGTDTNFGMDYWSIMDYGCYAGDGYRPAAYTAYERWMSGWLTPRELTSSCTVKGMQPLEQKAEAYVIYNDAHPDEYYLLENRQAVLSDSELPGHGMLVTHVDYSASAWENNTINNSASRQRCTIIAADNSYRGSSSYYDDLDGDPYPGSENNTSLTDESTPAAKLYNKNGEGSKLMGKPLTGISESADGLISFEFMGGGTVISGVDEAFCASASSDGVARIYRADGTLLGRMSLAEFRGLTVAPGAYVLRFSDGRVMKLIR